MQMFNYMSAMSWRWSK